MSTKRHPSINYHGVPLGRREVAVMQCLRKHGPLTDRQLSDRLQLHLHCVSPAVTRLTQSGVAAEFCSVVDSVTGYQVRTTYLPAKPKLKVKPKRRASRRRARGTARTRPVGIRVDLALSRFCAAHPDWTFRRALFSAVRAFIKEHA